MTYYIAVTMTSQNVSVFAILIIFILEVCYGVPRVNPLVHTNVGLIQGSKAQDGDYSMFLGIPFGKVDEKNPFGPAAPYPSFEETFTADDDSAICPQVEEFNNTVVGSIDCLHLNVYVPNSATSNNLLPVLVWIYGGGFTCGFSGRYLYGPKYLVRHDVILVTVNYRLGPYGFMCLDTPEYPGNQGLKDQFLGLKWVNENIQSFGGNADNITIFGESAGGASVDYHVRSDKEKLFNKAIMQSGTAIIPGLRKLDSRNAIIKLAAVLGLETEDWSQAVSFLSTVDPKLVISAVYKENIDASLSDAFGVCIEKQFENVEAFVNVEPVFQDIPNTGNLKILIGYNNKEVDLYSNWAAEDNSSNLFVSELKQAFDFDDEKLHEMADIVKHFYIGDDSSEFESNASNFMSDFLFNHPIQRSINKYLMNDGVKDVYHYVFSYYGGRNFVQRRNNQNIGGAIHADEIGYLFDVSFWTEEPEAKDQLVVDRMTTMWANFAKYGNPTPEATDVLPVKWEPVSPNSLYYLDINTELSLKTRPFHERLTFWDLFFKTNEEYQKDYSKHDEE